MGNLYACLSKRFRKDLSPRDSVCLGAESSASVKSLVREEIFLEIGSEKTLASGKTCLNAWAACSL